MKRKRVLFPDEIKRFDPKEPGGEETNEGSGQEAEENGAEEDAGGGDDGEQQD